VWIVLFVALAVVSRESPRFYRRHVGHRAEIAEAIGSIGFFYGPPQPDHSGSRVFYLRTSEKGLGLFNLEVGSGKATLLGEWEPPGIIKVLRGQGLLPLSPDDRFLPVVNSRDAFRVALTLCEAESGKELARMEVPGWTVAEGAWLTPARLAWLTHEPLVGGKPTAYRLHLTEQQPDGRWADRTARPALTNASCLCGVSDDTVAWLDTRGICTMDFASNSVATLFSPEGKRITGINHSRERRQFLVTCREKDGYSLWRLELKANGPGDFSQLTWDSEIRSAQWVNWGQGYAYLNHQNSPVVTADAAARSVQLKQLAVSTMAAAPGGDGLFLVGVCGNEAGLGLWRYGATNQALTNLVCYSDAPSPRATRVRGIHCSATSKSGKQLHYYVCRPANYNWHKRYPLLIGDTCYGMLIYQREFDGQSFAEAMADCGAYVVIVERGQWFLKNEEEWGQDVMAVLDELKGDPTIDSGSIYLCAVSVETAYLCKLLEPRPELWRGVVLLNPGQLPDLSALKPGKRLPRMLISAGKEEHGSERFKRYQEEACRRGMKVEIAEHPNAAHVLTSIPSLRDRLHVMERFIFEE
jgi:hypothetical protein